MKKTAVCAGLIAVAALSTSCSFNFSFGSSAETAKLEDMFVELICTTSDSVTAMTSTDFSSMSAEELTAASTAMEAKAEQTKKDMEALPAKYGFATEGAAQEAFNKISDKEAFKKSVSAKATAKCNPKSEILNGILSEAK